MKKLERKNPKNFLLTAIIATGLIAGLYPLNAQAITVILDGVSVSDGTTSIPQDECNRGQGLGYPGSNITIENATHNANDLTYAKSTTCNNGQSGGDVFLDNITLPTGENNGSIMTEASFLTEQLSTIPGSEAELADAANAWKNAMGCESPGFLSTASLETGSNANQVLAQLEDNGEDFVVFVPEMEHQTEVYAELQPIAAAIMITDGGETQARIYMNAQKPFATLPLEGENHPTNAQTGNQAWSFHVVAMHELGHALGLGHLNGDNEHHIMNDEWAGQLSFDYRIPPDGPMSLPSAEEATEAASLVGCPGV